MAIGGALTAQDHLASSASPRAARAKRSSTRSSADTVSLAGKPAVFNAASPAARVAIVNFALTLARTFVESDDFKRRYADHREANGPDPLPEEPTADAILAKQRAGFEDAGRRRCASCSIRSRPSSAPRSKQAGKTCARSSTEMEKGPRRAELEAALKRAARRRRSATARRP